MLYEVSQWYKLTESQICEFCKKSLPTGTMTRCNGFGGKFNPVYFFTCEKCNDESESTYERSCADVEIRESLLNDY